MTVVLKGGELELLDSAALTVVRHLPLITLPWLNEGPVLMGRNGRPRQRITLPGHNVGVKPASTGKTYPPEPLSPDEAIRLLSVIPQSHEQGAVDRTGVRDKALLTLLWRTGLRISEALDLRCHHVDFATRRVTVLHGKGDKRRTVGIDAGGLFALQPWLFERAMLGIDPAAPLFCTIQRPGRGGRIYPAYVRSKLHQYFSLTDVQAQLGHSNPATTAIYLRGLGADKAFARVAEREWPGRAS